MVDQVGTEHSHAELRVDADRLDAILAERRMTRKMLAEKLGMHPNSIGAIKKTGGTNLGTLTEMAIALNCHPFDLLVAEGFPPPFYRAPASH